MAERSGRAIRGDGTPRSARPRDRSRRWASPAAAQGVPGALPRGSDPSRGRKGRADGSSCGPTPCWCRRHPRPSSGRGPLPPVRVGCGRVDESAAMSPTRSGRLVRFAQVGRTGRGDERARPTLGGPGCPTHRTPLVFGVTSSGRSSIGEPHPSAAPYLATISTSRAGSMPPAARPFTPSAAGAAVPCREAPGARSTDRAASRHVPRRLVMMSVSFGPVAGHGTEGDRQIPR